MSSWCFPFYSQYCLCSWSFIVPGVLFSNINISCRIILHLQKILLTSFRITFLSLKSLHSYYYIVYRSLLHVLVSINNSKLTWLIVLAGVFILKIYNCFLMEFMVFLLEREKFSQIYLSLGDCNQLDIRLVEMFT